MLVPTTTERALLPLVHDLARHGSAVALVDGPTVRTYQEVAEEVAARAARLGPARRLVVLEAANRSDALLWYLASLHGGHVVLPAPADHPAHVAAAVAAYDPDVVVRAGTGDRDPEARREGSAHVLHPDLALLLSTSGSTGSPKLVRLSAANLQANAEAIATYLGLTPADRALTSLPLHYCYGLSVVHSHLQRGAGLVLTEASVVDPCFWQALRDGAATSFAGVPHTFELLERVGFEDRDLPSLRLVTQAGGRLRPELVRRYAELGARRGWELFVMYGQTEATARMAYLPPALAARRPEAVGVAIPGGSFRLDPLDGDDPVGSDVGELVYRGPNVMLGYAQGPADLALGPTLAELRTGDLARRAEDGLYELVGRRSRFLKLFGHRIDLDGVEAALATAGVPALCTGDDRRLVVGVVAGSGVERTRDLVRAGTSLPAGAVAVVEVAELPRLPTGKPDRAAVAALAGDPPAPPAADGDLDVAGLYARALHLDHVAPTDTFVGLGGDSLSYVEVSLALEDLLGSLPPAWHTLPVGQLAGMGTPRRALKRVETNVVLRAVAIVAVVGTHAGLFEQRGGAHALLAIAGFNFARFQLGAAAGARRMVASAARIAVPAVCWIALLVAVTDDYGLANVALVNGHLGAMDFDERWRFWFVEVVVQVLLLLAVAFAVPAVRRLEHRHRFAFALGVLGAALALRHGLVEHLDARHRTVQPQTVLWVFALGWAAQRAATVPQKLVVSVVAALSVRGFFFDEPVREALVAGTVVALVWIARVPAPRPLDRVLAPLAGASLFTYLTHWHVFPGLQAWGGPAVAVAGSLAVGIACWWAVGALTARGGQLARRLRARAPVGAPS